MKWLLALGIMFFNFMDYMYTSTALDMGIDEANPLVAMFINMDPHWLFVIKMIFVPAVLVFVLIASLFNVNKKRVNIYLIILFLVYAAALINHIYHTSLF